jgi:[histone H3]-lysine36 N-dimethyltransferase SETMAR
MVWLAISAAGVSRPLFIQPGAKINATYYQDQVLEPFFNKDPLWKPRFIFHQDSAPAHTARTTLQWLDKRGIRYITPEEWMPSSPDCAPCDYFLWGYLKSQISKRNPKTMDGLKKVIRDEARKIPQEMINNALRAWPKRCLQVYRERGGNIEQFRS